MKNCYIILFDTGLLKIGSASNLLSRIKKCEIEAGVHSVGVKKIWLAIDVADSEKLLCELINKASMSFEKFRREYFSCVNAEDVRSIIQGCGSYFIECLDVKGAGKSKGMLIHIGETDQARQKSELVGDGVIKSKIINALKNNGALKKGVVINRCRPSSKAHIESVLDNLEQSGIISKTKKAAGQRPTIEFYLN